MEAQTAQLLLDVYAVISWGMYVLFILLSMGGFNTKLGTEQARGH